MSISLREPLSSGQKTASLAVLYFVQGLPYGFQDKLVPLVLIERGHSASSVALTRLLLLPWLAKPLLAPLIETTLTKAKWVTLSLLSLAAVSLLNVVVPESADATTISAQLSGTLFTLNLFSAVQDIAVDAIAIAVLCSGGEVASGNAGQVVGYKLGAFFGSGVLFWIYASFGWNGLFGALCCVYVAVTLVFQVSIGRRLQEINVNQWPSLRQIWRQLRGTARWSGASHSIGSISPSMTSLLVYLVLYKLGESAATTTFPFFLTRSGVSSGQISFWNMNLGMLISMLGSSLASQMSLSSLHWAIKLRLVPLFLQLMLMCFSGSHFDAAHPLFYYGSMISLVGLHFFGGIITVLTFQLLMTTCQQLPESFRATRYTLLSSIEVFGKLMFASLSGLCVDLVGFSGAQLLFCLLSIWPLAFLSGLNFESTRGAVKQS